MPTDDHHFLHVEVQRLTDEARTLLAALEPFAERVGSVIDYIDRLHGTIDEDAIDELRAEVGYDELLDACLRLMGHVAAAADDLSTVPTPPAWYDELTERRSARVMDEELADLLDGDNT